MENTLEILSKVYMRISPALEERMKRLFLGSCAVALGHGGILAVATKMKANRDTVAAGKKEGRQ